MLLTYSREKIHFVLNSLGFEVVLESILFVCLDHFLICKTQYYYLIYSALVFKNVPIYFVDHFPSSLVLIFNIREIPSIIILL